MVTDPYARSISMANGQPDSGNDRYDPVSLATDMLEGSRMSEVTKSLGDPRAHIAPVTALLVGTGYFAAGAYRGMQDQPKGFGPKAAGAYRGGMGSLMHARYTAAGTAVGASLLLGRDWESKLGGVAFALTDPISDTIAAQIAAKTVVGDQGVRKTTAGVYGWLHKTVSETKQFSRIEVLSSMAEEWKITQEALQDTEKLSKETLKHVKLAGRTLLSPLLAIPTWFVLNAGLRAAGNAMDSTVAQVKPREPEQRQEETVTDGPPNINPTDMNFNITYGDKQIDMRRADELYTSQLKRGIPY